MPVMPAGRFRLVIVRSAALTWCAPYRLAYVKRQITRNRLTRDELCLPGLLARAGLPLRGSRARTATGYPQLRHHWPVVRGQRVNDHLGCTHTPGTGRPPEDEVDLPVRCIRRKSETGGTRLCRFRRTTPEEAHRARPRLVIEITSENPAVPKPVQVARHLSSLRETEAVILHPVEVHAHHRHHAVIDVGHVHHERDPRFIALRQAQRLRAPDITVRED